jgi:hypothetical protein
MVEFAKLSGSGNDFICIDGRDGQFDDVLRSKERLAHFARTLCPRGLGVGADGVVFAVRPQDGRQADLGARFLEPDGSEAELCGNGSACFTRWAVENRWVSAREVRIQTPSGIARGREDVDRYIHVCIPTPEKGTGTFWAKPPSGLPGKTYLSPFLPVRVRVRSGDILKVYFLIQDDGTIVKVCLESVVTFLYTGTLHPELAARALTAPAPDSQAAR